MRLGNKVAIVTGGGQGIGRGIALKFSLEGAMVAIADIDLEAARNTEKEITSIDGKCLVIKSDIASSSDVKNVVRRTLEEFGEIDILVNNAGVRSVTLLLDTPEEVWNRTLAVNLTAQFLFIKEVAPHMIKQGKGKIINIASVSALKPYRNRGAYGVSKAGVAMLTRCAALELAPQILVNAIAPGIIHTRLTDPYLKEDTPDSKAMKAYVESLPIPRMGEPEDIANMAVFLASSDSDFCTGGLFLVDGGIMSA
jgi:NAD(P)-dependent dehydrogenase (short-subunit alcohol dehydrogenase family)